MRCFFLLFLVSISLVTQAQEFAPVGAKWYCSFYDVSGEMDYGYLESIREETVLGKTCKVVKTNRYWGATNIYKQGEQLIYLSDSNELFFYEPTIDTFQMLYDFNADSGDKWSIWLFERDSTFARDTLEFTVVSVGTKDINGQIKRSLALSASIVSQAQCFVAPSSNQRIVDGIGNLYQMFPWELKLKDIVADIGVVGSMTCYVDSFYGVYSTGRTPYCEYVNIEEIENIASIKIYPNPVSTELQILNKTSHQISYTIQDVSGRVLLKGNAVSDASVDVSDFTNGLYLFTAYDENSQPVIVKRFVKQD